LSRNPVAQQFARARGGHRSRLFLALLVVPFMFGVIAAPAVAPGPVMGDELADAKSQKRALERKITEQKALVATINSSQDALEGRIASTKGRLEGIAEDLGTTRKRVASLKRDIDGVRKAYQSLVDSMSDLELQLQRIELQETDKRDQLRQRKADLANRIRDAYEAERTSMLETFLSGASFTDMLAVMSTQLDAAEQDRALAQQIAKDRETLLSLHRTVEDTKAQTDVLRQETAVQKQKLDRRLEELRKQQARLKVLEKAAKAALANQRSAYERLAQDKAKLRRALAAAAASRRALQKKINKIIASQVNTGNIPSAYNGTLAWPMGGTVSQDFGCTGFGWEPPSGGCAHWHNGIDIVAPYGTKVRASGGGRVVYCGWNYADGADPAWIVIIAHSSELTTWYAHLQARCPARTGSQVSKGQTIGYEGNTGHSTGAHLHWMVYFRGSFVNPRLFT
jgi:murein DD-endopeptidase MepM/ murein hydrolase activator NlpD